MSSAQERKTLPRALLLLFLSFQFLITPVSKADEETDFSIYFFPTVEFAVEMFNQKSQEEYAYRVEHILSSWKEKVSDHIFACPALPVLLRSEGQERGIHLFCGLCIT